MFSQIFINILPSSSLLFVPACVLLLLSPLCHPALILCSAVFGITSNRLALCSELCSVCPCLLCLVFSCLLRTLVFLPLIKPLKAAAMPSVLKQPHVSRLHNCDMLLTYTHWCLLPSNSMDTTYLASNSNFCLLCQCLMVSNKPCCGLRI